MAIAILANAPLQCVAYRPPISRNLRWYSKFCDNVIGIKRNYLFINAGCGSFAVKLHAKGVSGENETASDGNPLSSQLEQAKVALQESQSMQEAIEKERDRVIEELAKLMKEVAEREKVAAKAFKSEVDAIMAALEAAKETTRLKEQLYMRRYAALQRSLQASEAALKMWMERAQIAESILRGERSEEEVNYVINGGRIDILTDDDSQKRKLLAEGPRREIPEWMARRISSICPKFPPRKIDVSKALSTETLLLNLPKPDEVWSIAQEKPKETDVFVEHADEKDATEKKREALERALQRKTVKVQKIPELTKLEPGTGTGREIVVSILLKTVQ